ncbi:MAG TPA: glycosyltransferase family 9 protein [Chitinophagales bacterium]|nr:glycosyltransferase family 9 protein [Chitinophagales bacterium]
MKVLVIRFSSIGDIVLTSPVVRCLKTQLHGADIHFLTKQVFQEIPAANPHISKVYSMQQDIAEVMQELQQERYDIVVDLHDNIRSRQVCAQLKQKKNKVYRYNKQRFRRFLLTTFQWDVLHSHVVDRYFSAVKALGIINDGKGLDYFIPEQEDIPMGKLPFTHLAGYAVVVVGAQHFTKQIPLEKLQELCSKMPIPVILIGGKEDAYTGTQIEAVDNFKIYNACGKYSIHQSASIIRKAKFVVTPDTGMMHIAAAFRKRIISVWGSTEKRLGFIPYQNEANTVIIENAQLSCRPCHKHGRDACPKGHFKCMMELDMQKVIDVL